MKPKTKDDWRLILDMIGIIRTASHGVLWELRRMAKQMMEQEKRLRAAEMDTIRLEAEAMPNRK